MLYYVKCNGQRWKVREATSLKHALNAIAAARVSGSIGSKTIINEKYIGGNEYVSADVVRVNSDYTEQKPYQELY